MQVSFSCWRSLLSLFHDVTLHMWHRYKYEATSQAFPYNIHSLSLKSIITITSTFIIISSSTPTCSVHRSLPPDEVKHQALTVMTNHPRSNYKERWAKPKKKMRRLNQARKTASLLLTATPSLAKTPSAMRTARNCLNQSVRSFTQLPFATMLISSSDKLRKCGAGQDLDLPQLVIVGKQSAGKSSLLQSLTDIPFPVGSRLCTQFAMRIVSRRTPPGTKDKIYASIESGDINPFSIREDDSRIKDFGRPISDFTPEAFEDLIEDVSTCPLHVDMSPADYSSPGQRSHGDQFPRHFWRQELFKQSFEDWAFGS